MVLIVEINSVRYSIADPDTMLIINLLVMRNMLKIYRRMNGPISFRVNRVKWIAAN